MTEQKQDLRVVRTKEAIRSALKALVCELPYEKVTVKAIADRANINRNTFYLHYETPDDVLREIQAEHSEVREGMQKKVSAHTHQKSKSLHEKNTFVQNIVRAYTTTVLTLYRQWVADGRKIPMEEMIRLATTLLEGGMSGFRKL